MNIISILLTLCLALLLYFIMIYLRKKGTNLSDIIILPNIYIIIIAALIPSLKNYTLLLVIIYLIFDILNVTLINKKELLANEKGYYKTLILTLIIAHIIYYTFLIKVENAFIDMEIFKNFIWLLIILYGIKKLNLMSITFKKEEKETYDDRFQEYVVVNYAKFKNRYAYLIKSKDSMIEDLMYSFLIYENFNHGYLYNVFKNVKNKIIRKNSQYGILNITSDHFITNEESIVILKERLETKLKRIKKSKDKNEDLKKLISEKYKESKDYREVKKIYDIIFEFKKEN